MKRPILYTGISLFVTTVICEILRRFAGLSAAAALIAGLSFAIAGLAVIAVAVSVKKPWKFTAPVSVVLISVAVALSNWAFNYGNMNDARLNYAGKTVEITATVTDYVKTSGSAALYYIKPTKGMTTAYKLLYQSRLTPETEVGDTITGTFNLEELYYPERYDADRVILYASLEGEKEYSDSKPGGFSLRAAIAGIRNGIEKTLKLAFGEESDIAESLILGGSRYLDEEEYTSLKNSGLLHITCVSGLHVGIFVAFIAAIFSFFKKKAITVAGVTISVLCLLTVCGFSPSSVRAAILALILIGYRGTGRKADGLNLLAIPMTILLLINPFYAADVSFLLSFASAFSIKLFYEPVKKNVTTRLLLETGKVSGKILSFIIDVFSVSLICSVATLPISLIFFGSASAASVLSGMLCLWAVTPVYVGTLIILALYNIPFLRFIVNPLIFAVKIGIKFITGVASFISGLGFSVIGKGETETEFGIWSALFTVGVYILLAFFPVKQSKKSKKKKNKTGMLFSIFLAFTVLLCAYFIDRLKVSQAAEVEGLMQVCYVNVGQGSASVIFSGDKTAVVDCGGTNDPGGKTADCLLKYGREKADYMILSHLHSDHVNGVTEFLKKIDVDTIYIPYTEGDDEYYEQVLYAAEIYGAKVSVIKEDTEFDFGNGKIKIYTKHLNVNGDQNDNSMITVASCGDMDYMFTGDITAPAEQRFVASYPFVSADVLAVPHHGSAYSSSEIFLAAVRPALSVISVSENNSYGHPHEDTVKRLSVFGTVLTTKDNGNITVTTDGKGYIFESEK